MLIRLTLFESKNVEICEKGPINFLGPMHFLPRRCHSKRLLFQLRQRVLHNDYLRRR